MGLPTPKYPLTDHCSIVHEETLYVYSPEGFQSLQLGKGGEWKTLPMDISLTGAQCVKAVPGGNSDDARLYIVGGTVNSTASTWDYPGMMFYSIKEKKWDWIRSTVWSMKDRVNHAAIYLDKVKAIAVFSGSQVGYTGPTSETFLMGIEKPFASIASQGPAPVLNPQMKQWDEQRALMVGGTVVGGDGNTDLWTFNPDSSEGWKQLSAGLPSPLASPDSVQSSLISGTDGSKVLELFDMSVTPNKVTRLALLKAGGEAAATGTTVGDAKQSSKEKRLTLADWPEYNSTYAPTVQRTGSSLAQGDDDTVVITGGSKEDALIIFDQQLNSWKNATELFSGKQSQNILATSSSTSSSATATATPSAAVSSPAAAPASVTNKDRMLTVLGATLGAIFGIAALLILLLFCLKWRKSKGKGQPGGYQEKDRLSFADRGDVYMSEPAMHKFEEANMSQTSLAIIGGAAGGRPAGHKKGMLSDGSTSGLIKKSSPLGYSEPVELSKFNLKPEQNTEALTRQNSGRAAPTLGTGDLSRSRSSGWSRYFANNVATNLAQMPSDRSTFASDRTSTASQSQYTNSRYQPSQAVPPLDIPKFEGQRVSKVARGSPTMGHSSETLPGVAMQAQLSRADSNGSTHSGYSRDDHYLRDSVDSWSPVNDNGRPPSSAYTGSVIIDDFRQTQGASYYDENFRQSNYSYFPGQTLGDSGVRESTATTFPGVGALSNTTTQQQTDLFPTPPRLGVTAPEGRDSTVTVFPGLHAGT
ncbi:hypothetical protein P280DRAFT_377018, partial [Massarina eburnea CBS 473.64]